MYTHSTTIRMGDTDAAGVLYFASLLRLAHQAYEDFLAARGLPLAALVKAGRIGLPIRHAEADFLSPLFLGDHVTIEVAVDDIGQHAFTLRYRVLNAKGRLCATASTVHVAIRPNTGKKTRLPPKLTAILQRAMEG